MAGKAWWGESPRQCRHVPRRGETVQVGPLAFHVMLTRGGAVRWFKVSRVEPAADGDGA